jgi:hypothetical protein
MSSDFSQEIDFQVYPVAVDFDPVLWAVDCEICGCLVSEGVTDEAVVGRLEVEHKAFHAGLGVAEYVASRRRGRSGGRSGEVGKSSGGDVSGGI